MLEEAGLRCRHVPLIEIQPFDTPDTGQRQLLLGLSEFQHVIFISRNAIRHGMAWIEDYWPQLPVGLHWYAVGHSSARLLEEYGVRALTPESEMSSEGLLALPSLQHVGQQRVLIVRGEGGRSLLRESLEARGARVEDLVVYRRTLPAYAPGELAAEMLADGRKLVLISSGEGFHNMLSLLDSESTAVAREFTVIAPGERVAEQVREAGFKNVLAADSATDEAMVAAACQAAASL
jgi:uroporphyrinogen-III synthase